MVTCTLKEPSHLKLYRVHGVEIVIIRKLLSKTVLDLNMSKINWPGVRLQKSEPVLARFLLTSHGSLDACRDSRSHRTWV